MRLPDEFSLSWLQSINSFGSFEFWRSLKLFHPRISGTTAINPACCNLRRPLRHIVTFLPLLGASIAHGHEKNSDLGPLLPESQGGFLSLR